MQQHVRFHAACGLVVVGGGVEGAAALFPRWGERQPSTRMDSSTRQDESLDSSLC